MGTPPTTSGMLDPRMMAVVKKQRIQDFLFHKVTMLFAVLVLVALAAILVSLAISRFQPEAIPISRSLTWVEIAFGVMCKSPTRPHCQKNGME